MEQTLPSRARCLETGAEPTRADATLLTDGPRASEQEAKAKSGDETSDSSPAREFQKPTFISAAQWRLLRENHEQFVVALSGALSNYLGVEVGTELVGLEGSTYRQAVAKLPEPAHVALCRIQPLRGTSLLDVDPALGGVILDRLMGGKGETPAEGRRFSEIEVALLDQALTVILEQWCGRWTSNQSLRPAIVGHENTGRYLHTPGIDCPVLRVAVRLTMPVFTGEFRLLLPLETLEPLVAGASKADAKAEPIGKPAPAQAVPAGKRTWNPNFNDIQVRVEAVWPARKVSAREVSRLRVGDVVEWDSEAVNAIRLRLAKTAKFVGRLGTKSGKWSVEITGACQPGKI